MRNVYPSSVSTYHVFRNLLSLMFILALFVIPVISQAQDTLVANPITGTGITASPYVTGQVTAPNVSSTGIARGAGVTANAYDNQYNAQAWSTAATLSIANNDFFSFPVTPAAGYHINFSSFTYTAIRNTGNAPRAWAFRHGGDAFAANIGTATETGTTISLTGAAFQNVTATREFRYYGWDAVNANGNYGILDFSFQGSVLGTSATALTGFSACTNVAGAAQSFVVNGSGLVPANATITITPSANYEISITSATTGFLGAGTATVNAVNGDISQTVWVRLKANATAGNYNGELINVSGGGFSAAAGIDVSCSGTVAVGADTPGAITGPLDVCPHVNTGVPINYSIAPVAGAVSYVWTVPPGATIVSGQGTTSISVTIDNSYAQTNQQFKVRAVGSNGCESVASALIVLKNVPGIPAFINGPTNACSFIGQPITATYSITPVQYATSYTWTVAGTGISLVSGQGTLSVEVSFASNFTTGSVRVAANSNCGARAPRSLSVSRGLASAPVAINGPVSVCSFIGTPTEVTYSIDPVPNADSYVWTVPANTTLVSGQGTTSVNITFQNGFVTSPIKVRAINNCSVSGDRQLSLITGSPTIPGSINGPTNVCTIIGTVNDATYSIKKLNNAASYIWEVPAGATITSHPAGLGVNDTIITVNFSNSFVSGTSISVKAVNCFESSARTLAVFSNIAPSTPGLMTGPTNVCEFKQSISNPSGTVATYSIRKVNNATSYNWVAPANATITAHPNGPGVNDTIVEVIFSNAFTSGAMQVSASNTCGTSGLRSLNISQLTPGAPGGITAVQTQACPNVQYTYTIAAFPSNATSINWVVPAGGTIASGQGTLSITVDYTTAISNGIVSATALNNCGSSSTRNLTVDIAACKVPVQNEAPLFSKGSIPVAGLEASIYPNPAKTTARLQVLSEDKNSPVTVRILDLQGRELSRSIVMPSTLNNLGQNLKQGQYFVELLQAGRRQVVRFVKM